MGFKSSASGERQKFQQRQASVDASGGAWITSWQAASNESVDKKSPEGHRDQTADPAESFGQGEGPRH
jgi:hypothetical protein